MAENGLWRIYYNCDQKPRPRPTHCTLTMMSRWACLVSVVVVLISVCGHQLSVAHRPQYLHEGEVHSPAAVTYLPPDPDTGLPHFPHFGFHFRDVFYFNLMDFIPKALQPLVCAFDAIGCPNIALIESAQVPARAGASQCFWLLLHNNSPPSASSALTNTGVSEWRR